MIAILGNEGTIESAESPADSILHLNTLSSECHRWRNVPAELAALTRIPGYGGDTFFNCNRLLFWCVSGCHPGFTGTPISQGSVSWVNKRGRALLQNHIVGSIFKTADNVNNIFLSQGRLDRLMKDHQPEDDALCLVYSPTSFARQLAQAISQHQDCDLLTVVDCVSCVIARGRLVRLPSVAAHSLVLASTGEVVVFVTRSSRNPEANAEGLGEESTGSISLLEFGDVLHIPPECTFFIFATTLVKFSAVTLISFDVRNSPM